LSRQSCVNIREKKIIPVKEAIEILERGWQDVMFTDIAEDEIEFYQIFENGSSHKNIIPHCLLFILRM
jgi:DNA-directed RNA polymerase subunit F